MSHPLFNVGVADNQFIGQLLNHFSDGRILPYPEQKAGYVLPEAYNRLARFEEVKRGSTSTSQSLGLDVTPTDTVSSRNTEVTRVETELDQSGRPREEEVRVPKEVILVTWEGEDDPENPLNW